MCCCHQADKQQLSAANRPGKGPAQRQVNLRRNFELLLPQSTFIDLIILVAKALTLSVQETSQTHKSGVQSASRDGGISDL